MFVKYLIVIILFSGTAFASTYVVRDGNKSYTLTENKTGYSLKSHEMDLSLSKCSLDSFNRFNSQVTKASKELINSKNETGSVIVVMDKKELHAPAESEANRFFRDLPRTFIKFKTIEGIKCKS
jgi:hypothetical protein